VKFKLTNFSNFKNFVATTSICGAGETGRGRRRGERVPHPEGDLSPQLSWCQYVYFQELLNLIELH
jgi:hypothetical protein